MSSFNLPELNGEEVFSILNGFEFGSINDSALFFDQMIFEYSKFIQPLSSPVVSRSPSPSKSFKMKVSRSSPVSPASPYQSNPSSPDMELITDEAIDRVRLEIRRQRVKLGLTQAQAAKQMTSITGRKTSQTSLCRFENNQLHKNNMRTLYPAFKAWLEYYSVYLH
jgi:hypothetical protein